MISYAQNFEDVLLARALGGKKNGFYIDVGAWDPVVDSVTRHFYDLGWSGINVEPVPELCAVFDRDRPRDLNLQVALGSKSEIRTLHHFPGSGLSTLLDDPVPDYLALGFELREVPVRVTTLREICERHVPAGTEIDFLKIDVEGSERDVILGGDWDRFRPRIVLVEAVAPNPKAFLEDVVVPGGAAQTPAWEEWEGLLLGQGYELCTFDGLNRFYVRGEDRSLKAAFQVPPNVFDGFVTYRVVQAEAERDQLLSERDQARSGLQALQETAEGLRRELRSEKEEGARRLGEVAAWLAEAESRLAAAEAALRDAEAERDRLAGEVREVRAAQADLESRLGELAARLEKTDEQLRRATAERDGLAAARAAAEERVQSFLDSRSWRVTRPLRAVTKLAKRALRPPS